MFHMIRCNIRAYVPEFSTVSSPVLLSTLSSHVLLFTLRSPVLGNVDPLYMPIRPIAHPLYCPSDLLQHPTYDSCLFLYYLRVRLG